MPQLEHAHGGSNLQCGVLDAGQNVLSVAEIMILFQLEFFQHGLKDPTVGNFAVSAFSPAADLRQRPALVHPWDAMR